MKIFVLFFTLVLIPNLAFAGKKRKPVEFEMQDLTAKTSSLALKEKKGERSLSAETSLSPPHEEKAQSFQTLSNGLLPTLKSLLPSFFSPIQTSQSSSFKEGNSKPQELKPGESNTLLDSGFVLVPRKETTKRSKGIRAYQGGNLTEGNQANIYYWNIKTTSTPMLLLRCLSKVDPVCSYIYETAYLYRRSTETEETREPEDLAQFFDWAWSEASSYYKDNRDDLNSLLHQIKTTNNKINNIEIELRKINRKKDKEKLGDENQENKEGDLKISRERARNQDLQALLGINKNADKDEVEIKSKEINNAEDKKKLRNEEQQNQEEDLKVRLEQLERQKDELKKIHLERTREQEPLAILVVDKDDGRKDLFFTIRFKKLKEIANQTNPEAMLSLGQLYLWGLGCQQNVQMARQYMSLLALSSLESSSIANEILGLLSEGNTAKAKDSSKVAEKYYRKMAEQDPHGYIHLARLFPNEAIGFLESAAKKDYPPALWALAKLNYINVKDRRFETLQSYQYFLRNVHNHLRMIHFLQEAAYQNNSRAKKVLTNLRNELKNKGSIANLSDYFEEIVTIKREMSPESLSPEIEKSWREIFLEDPSHLTEEFEPIVYIDRNNPTDTFIPDEIDLGKISRSKIENCMRLAAAGFPMGYFLLGRYVMLINPALAEFCFQRAKHPKLTSYLAILTYITPGMGHLNADALKKEVEEDLKEELKKALKEEVEKKSTDHLNKTIKQGVTEEVKKRYEELHKKQLENLIRAKIKRVFKPGDEETWKEKCEELFKKKHEIIFKEKYEEKDDKARKKRAHALWDQARSEGDLWAYYCQGFALYEEGKNLTQLPKYRELSKEKLDKSNELLAYAIASQFKVPQLTPDNPTPKLPHYFARTDFRKHLEEIRANFTMQALEDLF